MNGPRCSRRRLLRVGAGVVAGSGSVSGAAGGAGARTDDEWGVSVATWNLGLGADFLSVARGESAAPIPERVGTLYRQVLDSRPAARMEAAAAVLAGQRPDVLGLQEAAIVRRGPRSGGAAADPDAGTVAVDHLDALCGALDDRGVPYRTAAVATNADLELPGRIDGEPADVRVTDRDALLIRDGADIDAAEVRTGTYDASLTLPIGADRTVAVPRGYVAADLDARGERVAAVTTHLEAALASVREAQAEELASVVASLSTPAVVLGDLNSGPPGRASDTERGSETPPGTDGSTTTTADPGAGADEDAPGAYGTLTAALDDPVDPASWPGASEHGRGTCCRPGSLRPPDADGLPRRIDHVLTAGLRASGSRRLGVDPAPIDGADEAVWPSDHAGVLADLTRAPETPTATETGTPTATETETTTSTTTSGTATGTPGFGAVTAVAALCVAAGAALRRRGGSDGS